MLRGLYIASSSLVAKTEQMNVTSNNLANVNTNGYKKDLVTYEAFKDIMLSKLNGQYNSDETTREPIDINKTGEVYTLDAKNGYFQVETKTGASFNKSVKFMKNAEGFLSTFYLDARREVQGGIGYRVQGQNGDIFIGDNEFEIGDKGQVLVNGQAVDQLVHIFPQNVIGTMNNGIRIDRVLTDFEQGGLVGTSNDLDFAIEGDGFFTVETPSGTRYTRAGTFKINRDYELVTNEGYNVMGFNGKVVLSDGSLNVNSFGEITIDGEIIDKFAMVNPKNIKDLSKIGNGLYKMDTELEDMEFEGQIKQGFIENSNVNTISGMIEVMDLYRNYESSQKLVTTYDATLEKVINEVGVV